MKVVVLGAGSWGTALALVLARKGINVSLWSRDKQQVEEMKVSRENSKYIPGITFPSFLSVSNDLEEAIQDSNAVVLAVPSHAVRETTNKIKPFLKNQLIINTAKGIEPESSLRLSQVIAQEAQGYEERIVVLSGPSHAEEVAKDIPTAIVMASQNSLAAKEAQDLFMAPNFRVYTNEDLIGVELGGALKNVIALCTGISDGLGFGDNTKAALMTRGLAEITRLGVEMGADPLTFSGLTGVGDLIVTCTSVHSRNRRAGVFIGEGLSVQEATEKVKMVVEGIRTTKAAYYLAEKVGVEMPITQQAYKVLFEGVNPKDAVVKLMLRDKTSEIESYLTEDKLCH